MGLIDYFDKFIVERGSAIVQEKHLALFKDQLLLADKRINELETENTALKKTLEDSEATINQLTKDNEVMQGKIKKSLSHNILDEDKTKILIFLSKQHNSISAQDMANSLPMNIQVVNFHLEELEKKANMVHGAYSMHRPRTWTLIQEGRRYLIESKLIS